MPRRSFDKAFKISAVKMVTEEGFSVKEFSLQLEVHANSWYRWVQEVEKYGENTFPEKWSALFDDHFEIKKLKQENRYLREDLDLLKKFQAFLKPNKK